MENKLDTNEIEESLRICEELFQNNRGQNAAAPHPKTAAAQRKCLSFLAREARSAYNRNIAFLRSF